MNPLDYAELQACRDKSDEIHAIDNPQQRGNRFRIS